MICRIIIIVISSTEMQSRKLILEILKIVVQSPETHSSCDDCGIIVYHLISNKLISFDMVSLHLNSNPNHLSILILAREYEM
jgi:hypothetical protein